MASYVVYGLGAAVAIHRGFACTRDELPVELRRAAAEQGLAGMIRWECLATREAADAVAASYCLKARPLTRQELRWINEGANAQASGR